MKHSVKFVFMKYTLLIEETFLHRGVQNERNCVGLHGSWLYTMYMKIRQCWLQVVKYKVSRVQAVGKQSSVGCLGCRVSMGVGVQGFSGPEPAGGRPLVHMQLLQLSTISPFYSFHKRLLMVAVIFSTVDDTKRQRGHKCSPDSWPLEKGILQLYFPSLL